MFLMFATFSDGVVGCPFVDRDAGAFIGKRRTVLKDNSSVY